MKKINLFLLLFLGFILILGCTTNTQTENQQQKTTTKNQETTEKEPKEKIQENTQTTTKTSPSTTTQQTTIQTTNTQTENQQQKISLKEIANHSSRQDCWMAINGKVYDVTKFISSHPGGSAILQGCGKDATNLFETRPMGSGTPHSQNARNLLESYYIGELEK